MYSTETRSSSLAQDTDFFLRGEAFEVASVAFASDALALGTGEDNGGFAGRG